MTMRRRPSARRPVGRRTSAPTFWWNTQSVPATVAAGALLNFPTAGEKLTNWPAKDGGFTILRAILTVAIRNVTANQDIFGAFSLTVVTNNVSGTDPIQDDLDAYVHQNFWQRGADAEPHAYNYDLRSARRIRGEDRELDFDLANNSASSGSLAVSFCARLLIRGG